MENKTDLELLEFETENGRMNLYQLLLVHGVTMPMDTQAFEVLYEMACMGQSVRMAYDDNGHYYEWSPVAIALMRPFMVIGRD